jgi:hypothetical protein
MIDILLAVWGGGGGGNFSLLGGTNVSFRSWYKKQSGWKFKFASLGNESNGERGEIPNQARINLYAHMIIIASYGRIIEVIRR